MEVFIQKLFCVKVKEIRFTLLGTRVAKMKTKGRTNASALNK